MSFKQADAEGRAVWLASSNVAANTGLYNSLGFITVDTIYLGDDNPTWTEPPIPIDVVSTARLLLLSAANTPADDTRTKVYRHG